VEQATPRLGCHVVMVYLLERRFELHFDLQ